MTCERSWRRLATGPGPRVNEKELLKPEERSQRGLAFSQGPA